MRERNQKQEKQPEKKLSIDERIAELEAKLEAGDETVKQELNRLNGVKKFTNMLRKGSGNKNG